MDIQSKKINFGNCAIKKYSQIELSDNLNALENSAMKKVAGKV